MKIDEMREFVAFAQYMNFSNAAKHLFISQSTLSYHIASMEKELGCTLVNRVPSISFTQAGRRFLDVAQRLVEEFDEVAKECHELGGEHAGRLILQTPVAFDLVNDSMQMDVIHYLAGNPGSEITYLSPLHNKVGDLLAGGVADICITFSKRSIEEDERLRGQVEYIPLSLPQGLKYYAWINKDTEAAKKGKVIFYDLKDLRYIMPRDAGFATIADWVADIAALTGVGANYSYRTATSPTAVLPVEPDMYFICTDTERQNPILASIKDMVIRPIEDKNVALWPCYVFLKSNSNPALSDFVQSLGNRS
ncbi:MAG: LysR family transcriptional regulator [Eggerthellaceae bacterium]|nr:LysR family transcriptional regulator [Eggerthellaceae bacterium]